MAAKLLKKRFNIQNVNDWLAENDKNMDGKPKNYFKIITKPKFLLYPTFFMFVAWTRIRIS